MNKKHSAIIRKREAEVADRLSPSWNGQDPKPVLSPEVIIQISEAFWPYQRSLVQEPEAAESQYLDQVACLLLDAPGVQCSFSPADRQLAARLYRQGLSLRQIEQALLLGCARKHVAWLNGHTGGPITSLSYFEPLIQEVRQQPVSDQYWDYLRSRLKTRSGADPFSGCARKSFFKRKSTTGPVETSRPISDSVAVKLAMRSTITWSKSVAAMCTN